MRLASMAGRQQGRGICTALDQRAGAIRQGLVAANDDLGSIVRASLVLAAIGIGAGVKDQADQGFHHP
jgi:hypothetical protein